MTLTAPPSDEICRALAGIRIRTDIDALTKHGSDWTGRFHGTPVAVAFPESTAEVVRVVGFCRERDLPITPQGGNTGLVGGAVASRGGIIVSTTRLTGPPRVDLDNWLVEVQAGVTLETLHDHVEGQGARFGVDFASRGTATVGGAIATNAGGARVIRHGSMRHQLLGVEAVLPDGRIVSRLRGLRKDNTGLDLASLLCGSEGTLGIITRAQLRILSRPHHISTALIGLDRLDAIGPAIRHARGALGDLEAAELILGDTMQRVCGVLSLPVPLRQNCSAYLLIECAGDQPQLDRLIEVIADMPGLVDATADTGTPNSRRLWAYREGISEALSQLSRTPVVKIDVSVPSERLHDLLGTAMAVVGRRGRGAQVHVFGHAGDGNVHINLLDAPDEELEGVILERVIELGGAISAEHGIGTAKTAWLAADRGSSDVGVMKDIKRAVDRRGLMNPGVVFVAADSEGPPS